MDQRRIYKMNLYEYHTNPEALYGYEILRMEYANPTLEMCERITDNNTGSIDFSEFPFNLVQQLPVGITVVNGSLNITHTQVTHLSNITEVGWDILALGSQITHLPDNLTVRGSLFIGRTQITHLPNNLEVYDDLVLDDTPITHIGNNLIVGNNLYIRNTPNLDKTNLPSDMQVETMHLV
jgi:hypothetical protein